MTELSTNKIQVLNIVEGTTVDGPGFRTTIYCAGCSHHCPGCHNPQTWDCNQGTSYTVDELLAIIKKANMNVTFSGGDPMFRPEGFAELAKRIHAETNFTIWCYTGYTYEELQNDPRRKSLMDNIDVMVDGRFKQEEKDLSLIFKGSRNQRLIDMNQTRKANRVIEYNTNF